MVERPAKGWFPYLGNYRQKVACPVKPDSMTLYPGKHTACKGLLVHLVEKAVMEDQERELERTAKV